MALTAVQLAARANRIGGSDAPNIVGKGHGTAYEVGMRILGQMPPNTDLDDADFILFGNEMEGVLAKIYVHKHPDQELYIPDTIIHPKYDFLAANIDRRVKGRPELGLEMKNTGQFVLDTWGQPGTDEVPDRVNVQVQHCMMCAPEIETFTVLRAFGGNTYQEYYVPRNNYLIESLLNIELEFMNNLKAGNLPEPDWGHRATSEALKRAFSKITGVIENRPDLEHWTKCFQEVAAARLEAEKLEEAIKNRVLHMMGNAEVGLLPSGYKWRRKQVARAGYVVEPTSYVELRLMKPKA